MSIQLYSLLTLFLLWSLFEFGVYSYTSEGKIETNNMRGCCDEEGMAEEGR